ncbi:MAG: 50S ribosomal protein L6, partial [Lentisphaeria bacterium]
MSRMGNKQITLSKEVKLEVNGQEIKVTGSRGALSYTMPEGISLEQDGTILSVKRESDDRKLRMKHGLVRSLLNGMIIGVSEGFKKQLELFGVGYRGQIAGKT